MAESVEHTFDITNKTPTIQSVWGGQEVIYELDIEQTSVDNEVEINNYYIVLAKVRFLDNFKIELDFTEVKSSPDETDSNEHTLTHESLLEYLTDEVQAGDL